MLRKSRLHFDKSSFCGLTKRLVVWVLAATSRQILAVLENALVKLLSFCGVSKRGFDFACVKTRRLIYGHKLVKKNKLSRLNKKLSKTQQNSKNKKNEDK